MTKMHTELVVAFVLLSLISSGLALECYTCTSTESWAMCMRNRYVRTCDPWEDRCYKVSVDTSYESRRVSRFTRGCTSAKMCYDKSIPDCGGGKGKKYPLACDVYCCSGNICNAGSIPLVSGIVFVTCALLGLLFF